MSDSYAEISDYGGSVLLRIQYSDESIMSLALIFHGRHL